MPLVISINILLVVLLGQTGSVEGPSDYAVDHPPTSPMIFVMTHHRAGSQGLVSGAAVLLVMIPNHHL